MLCYEMQHGNNEETFVCKAILLFTLQDFVTNGMVASCVTKGYGACPICGPQTI